MDSISMVKRYGPDLRPLMKRLRKKIEKRVRKYSVLIAILP